MDTAAAFLGSVNRALGRTGLRSATRREISCMDLRSIISERLVESQSSRSVDRVFDSIWDAFADTLSSPFPLRDRAPETLKMLSGQGIGLALISKRGGRAGMMPLTELREADLETLFRFVKVGVRLREYGATITRALQTLESVPQETLVVSDWCKDIEYAKHAGLRTVGIVGGVSDEDEHRSAGADWIVENLSEIPRILALK